MLLILSDFACYDLLMEALDGELCPSRGMALVV